MTDLLELLSPEHPIATHPDLPDVKVFLMAIGPALADKILAGYKVFYRPFIKSNGEALTRAMENKQWIFDGAPIRLLKDGSFADGQHRMTAVKQSGKTHIFLVVMGLDVKAYDSMDTGAIRNYAASLIRRGYTKNAPLLAWFIQLIHRWENNLPLLSEGKVIHPELDVVFDKHKDEILRCIDLTVSGSKRIKMAPALVAFCWWMFRRIDVEKASTFMTQVAYGEHIGRGDPSYALKNKLDDIKVEVRLTKGNAYNRHHYLHLTFMAFNAFEGGIPLVNLRKGDGSRSSLDKIDPITVHLARLEDLKKSEEKLNGNA